MVGAGTTGAYTAVAGTNYFITETATSGSLNNYNAIVTCVDANGLTSGLVTGYNATTSGFPSIQPVQGAAITCTITNNPGPIITGFVPNGIVGQPYFFAFTSSGDLIGCTVSAYNLPAGLTLSYDTTLKECILSGTPTTAQVDPGFGINGTNAAGGTGNIFSLPVTIATTTTPFISGNAPDPVVGVAYSYTFNTNTSNCSLASYNPPAGMTIAYNTTTGRCVLSGTPTTAVANTGFGINVTNGGVTTNMFVQFNVVTTAAALPTITGTPPNANVGIAYSYTLTFDNSLGEAPATVDETDDLTKVLDDATIQGAPVASDTALTVGAVTSGTFTITGQLAAGANATVIYTVQVNNPDSGDHNLVNFIDPTGTATPATCVSSNPDCTVNPVPQLTGLAFTGIVDLPVSLSLALLLLLLGSALTFIASRRLRHSA